MGFAVIKAWDPKGGWRWAFSSVFSNPWVSRPDSFKPITLNFRYNDFVVANFLDDDRQWDVGKVKNFFIMLTKMLFCRVMWVI